MPRFTARNAVVAINILLLTALFVHLKYEIWDKHAPAPDLGLSHLPDELLDDSIATRLHDKDDKKLQVNAGLKARRTAVVVASQASENATWLSDKFPTWETNIYRVDDPHAPLTVPKNKGRESMVYLTYVLSSHSPPSPAAYLVNADPPATSSIIMIIFLTMFSSFTRTAFSGTMTTLTTMAYRCSATSKSHILRKRDTSTFGVHGRSDAPRRSSRWRRRANIGKLSMLVETTNRPFSTCFRVSRSRTRWA
jgi:hypothetical protein